MKRLITQIASVALILLLSQMLVQAGITPPTGNITSASCTTGSVTLTYSVSDLGGEDLLLAIVYPDGDIQYSNIPDASSTVSVSFDSNVRGGDKITIAIGNFDIGTISQKTITCSGSSGSGHLPVFTDGRINDYDAAAPVAVYPYLDNGETGLQIYDVDGVLLLVITPEQLAAAPDNPDSPVLIAEAFGVALYRVPGGFWQINAPQYNGKTYVMIFKELFASGGYDSFEIEP